MSIQSSLQQGPVSYLALCTFVACGTETAIKDGGLFGGVGGGVHGLNQIFKIKRNRWFRARVCRSLGVRHGPLSVHPVKGLSAAGVGVESEGSSRVQAASQECLCLSAHGRSGVGQLARGQRGRDGVYAAATFMQFSHQKSPSSLLNWP